MTGHEEGAGGEWADAVAKWTFVVTLVLALLYVGSVFAFILPTP